MKSSERRAFDAQAILGPVRAAWPSLSIEEAVGRSENFVFSADRGEAFVRITPESRRSRDAILAELDLVAHLHGDGVAVAPSIPCVDGCGVVTVETDAGLYHVAVFARAPGVQPQWGDAEHNRRLLAARGRALGLIHRSIESFEFRGPVRPRWDEERAYDFLRDGTAELPEVVTTAWTELQAWTAGLGREPDEFGVIHGDFGSPNYRDEGGVLTAFDFDDAVRAWFDLDLATSLWPTGLMPEEIRFQFRDALFEAYAEVRPLPADAFARLEKFCQLRTLFLWAHWEIGTPREERTEDEQKRQDRLLGTIGEPVGWVGP